MSSDEIACQIAPHRQVRVPAFCEIGRKDALITRGLGRRWRQAPPGISLSRSRPGRRSKLCLHSAATAHVPPARDEVINFPFTTWLASTPFNQRAEPEPVKFLQSKECSSGLHFSVPCCVCEKDYACIGVRVYARAYLAFYVQEIQTKT